MVLPFQQLSNHANKTNNCLFCCITYAEGWGNFMQVEMYTCMLTIISFNHFCTSVAKRNYSSQYHTLTCPLLPSACYNMHRQAQAPLCHNHEYKMSLNLHLQTCNVHQ